MKNKFTFLVTLICLLMLTLRSEGQDKKPQITSVTGKLIRVTPKLADIDPNTMYGEPLKITRNMNGVIGFNEEGEEKLERQIRKRAKHYVDPLINANKFSPNSPISPNVPVTGINQNFDGLSWTGFDPSDNNLAVGPNHVIQIINDLNGSRFKIWNKAGAVIGNAAGTILSTVTGVSGAGDPVVLYDQLADRWVLTEFGPSACCNSLIMAVSVTPDPTGAWKVYQYTDPSFFPDYPKYALWHNGYYATTADFTTGGNYLGGSIWAFDRNAMIAGAPTASMVRVRLFDNGSLSYWEMNPVAMDGTTAATSSGLFAVPDQGLSTMNLFEFTPNFTTPANSVVGPLIPMAIAPYNLSAGSISQQGSTQKLGTLYDRLMYRLSYRNRAGTESILIGQTVQGATTALAAVRWYELRKVAGNWTVYQQGTITGADGNSRWMPGISMDANGNIALMYNMAGPTAFPSIKYTARTECDPLGQMTLPEQTIVNGVVPHTSNSRWGDYNTLWADPNIVGSFWSTAEYGGGTGNATRVANFTISGGPATFTAQPANTTVCAGTTATFTATAAGNPPITYQWQVSTDGGVTWTNIPGATANTYSFTAAAGDNGKRYRCTAATPCGPGTSNAALLTITTLSQGGTISPLASVACQGPNSTTLTLNGAIGNILRWEQSTDGGVTWTNIANTTTTLTVTNITQTTIYRVLVQSSGCTPSYSAAAGISYVNPGIGPLTISANQGTTLCAGDPTLLTVMTANTFSNTVPIQVPAAPNTSGIGAPYPAFINVTGLPTTGLNVQSVTVSGITHTWESDISMVLQSPAGQNVILMSNVSGNENGGFGILNKTFTFSDAAATGLTAGVPSGTYKPTNNSTTRNWPAPGPGVLVQGVNPSLATFAGNPNGLWKLYVIDAVTGDAGTIAGGYTITFAPTPAPAGLTYSWTPTTGLNNATGNPVAASPATTTTYTVNATSPAGCTASASVTITVNDRPAVNSQPVSKTVCDGSATTFTIAATGTGLTYQWQLSIDNGVTYNNLTNTAPYSGVTTTTLNISAATVAMNNYRYRCMVTGTCPPVVSSNAAVLTVTGVPVITVTPTAGCGGVAGTNGLLLTASGGGTYTWSPAAGLYTDAAATIPYVTGTQSAKVYAAPVNFTKYIVTGLNSTTGCSNTASAFINYTPSAPVITPAAVTVCLGDPAVKLLKSSPAVSTQPAVWSPAAGLFSDASATIPYVAGTAVDSVWTRPTTSGVYNYSVTVKSLPPAPDFASTNFANNNSNSTITFNVKNNNPYAVTLSDIWSVVANAGAADVSVYYKTSAINGAPGAISAANGWTQFGSASITGTPGTVQQFMTGLNLSIPSGATYGICVQSLLAGGFNLAYSTIGAGTYTFSSGGCDITTGTNIGYGGTPVPAAPTFTPRGFIGKVGFIASVAPCTSPDSKVTVTVNQPLAFTQQPVNTSVCTDGVAVFTDAVTGSSATHNWQLSTQNGSPGSWISLVNNATYSGVKTATLNIKNPALSMDSYTYRDSVSAASICKPAISNYVNLKVNPLPTIVISASPLTRLLPGLTTTLFSTVTPAAAAYTWLRNGIQVPGAVSSNLVVNVDQLGDYSLKVIDVNGCSSVSNTVTISDSIKNGIAFITPTPNNGLFAVRYYSALNNINLPRGLNVYDATGKRVFTKQYLISLPYQKMDVDIRSLGTGVYWVEIVDVSGNRLAIGRTEVLR